MPPLTSIPTGWKPSEAVYEVLAQRNIPRDFIEGQVGEFVLYWNERGQQNHSWSSKFSKHVIHEWRLFEIKQAQAARVCKVTHEWRPSKNAVEHLLACGITQSLINECIVSFVMYWSERGDERSTWNSTFVEHVKHRYRQQLALANTNGGKRMQTLEEGLVDRSWADSPSAFSLPHKE